jgi:biotin carboxylase
MKEILVIGGGKESVPGLSTARNMGFDITLVDRDPECAGKPFAKQFIPVDTKAPFRILAQIELGRYDGVITYAHDVASTVAVLANRVGCVRGINPGLAFTMENKLAAAHLLRDLHLPTPEFGELGYWEQTKDLEPPYVLKPISNCGSRGVIRVTPEFDAWGCAQMAMIHAWGKPLMWQEWLDGPQFSTETVVYAGKCHHVGFSLRNYEYLHKYRPYVIENGGDQPAPVDKVIKGRATAVIQHAVHRLGVDNCIVKGDLVFHEGQMYIIELALRLSGGGFSSLQIPESTGVELLEVATKMATGIPVKKEELRAKKQHFCSNRFHFPPTEPVTCHADRGDMVWYTGRSSEEAIEGVKKCLDAVNKKRA